MTHRMVTTGAYSKPVLKCRYTVLSQHAVHHPELPHLCHITAAMLSTAGLIKVQCIVSYQCKCFIATSALMISMHAYICMAGFLDMTAMLAGQSANLKVVADCQR